MFLRTCASATVAVFLAASGHAATVITFEEMPSGLIAMGNVVGAAVPLSSQLTNQYLASNGVSFTSLAGYAALVDHGAGNPTASVPNIIGGTLTNGVLDYDAPITISFFDSTNNTAKATTGSFKIQGEWFGLGSGHAFATAYDSFGNVLGTTSDTDDKPFGVAGALLQFNIAGIHAVTIRGDNGTIGFDQLEFGALQAVPEAATGVLMLGGLSVLGALARGRRGKRDYASDR
jgi:hypothetical protein